MKKIIKILTQLPSSSNWKFWLCLSLCLKFVFFIFFAQFFSNVTEETILFPRFWGTVAPDTYTYLASIEKLIATHDLAYLFEFRMFGYGLPYAAARFFFEPSSALNLLIILQTILSVISVYYLSLLAVLWSKKEQVFYYTFFGYFIVMGISFYDTVALTESFSTSCLVISLYYLCLCPSKFNLLLSGSLLAWGIFMRPVFFPLLLIYIGYLVYNFYSTNYKKLTVSILVFLLPIFILESVWQYGMTKYKGEFHLTTPSLFHPSYLKADEHSMEKIQFLKAMGEDWEKSNWFTSEEKDMQQPCIVQTSAFNMDSLINLKTDLIRFDTISNLSAKLTLNAEIKKRLDAYSLAIKKEHLFHYYLLAPAKNLMRIALKSSTHRMFGEYKTMNQKLKPFRFILDSIFWMIELGFILAIFIFIKNRRVDVLTITIFSIILYFYCIHTIVFKSSDNRYLLPIMPFLVLVFTTIVHRLYSHFYSIKSKSIR